MRIVIAEDSVLLRDGLSRMLTDGGFEVVQAVPDAGQLLRAVAERMGMSLGITEPATSKTRLVSIRSS